MRPLCPLWSSHPLFLRLHHGPLRCLLQPPASLPGPWNDKYAGKPNRPTKSLAQGAWGEQGRLGLPPLRLCPRTPQPCYNPTASSHPTSSLSPRRKPGWRKGRGQEDKGREGRRFGRKHGACSGKLRQLGGSETKAINPLPHRPPLSRPPLSRGCPPSSSQFLHSSFRGRKGVASMLPGGGVGASAPSDPASPQTHTQLPRPQPDFIDPQCEA